MKLKNIISELYDKYSKEEKELEVELITGLSSNYRIAVRIAEYNQDRLDNDPLKGKGYGSVEFLHKDTLPDNEFKKAIDIISKEGYEVDLDQSSNYFDHDPGERYYYPKIKFKFDIK